MDWNTPFAAQARVRAARLSSNPLNSDVFAEVRQLMALSWIPHVNLRDYQGDWSVMPLRCLKTHQNAHPVLQGFAQEEGGDWQDLPVLQAAPGLGSLLGTIACPLKSARLMRLAAGAEIKPHRDPGLAWEYGEARLHLPLCTDPQVRFMVGGHRVTMNQGELWYLNADVEHSVVNAGSGDRIHLVVDVKVNDWLRMAILNGATAA
jgi:quercetin dioxygenase-like cupin family protein